MSQRIGHFEILRRLEAKAGAACYLGRDTRDGSSVIIDTWSAETAEAQALFLKRAAAAGRLEHDAIARILDFGIDGATSCRIEQSLGDETLADRLERSGELPIPTILDWLARVARALECAHGQGVVHGDLHPGAITVGSGNTVAVRGFATPRPRADARYQAPELPRGDSDMRTDMFAFGVLAQRMPTSRPADRKGRSHLPKSSHRDLQSGAIRTQLDPQAANSLSALLAACREDDPDRRPASFAVVAKAIEDVLQQLAVPDAGGETRDPGPNDWTEAAVLNGRSSCDEAESILDSQVRIPQTDDDSLVDLELDGRGGPAAAPSPPTLDQVADAVRQPRRSRLRRRWLTFAAVTGTAIWLVGTLWWWKGSPLAGSEAPVAQTKPREGQRQSPRERPGEKLLAASTAHPRPSERPAAPATDSARPVRQGRGRLALAPAWDPSITVSVDGETPVVLDRRRVFEVEAGVDHVLTFELATRDYQIREQVVTQVGVGRLLETPVPLVRPGAVSVAPETESERPVFVRIGEEAIGWTPIRDLPLPAGDHVLTLFRNPTWQPDDRIDQSIRVESGQRTTVQFALESEPAVLIVNGRRMEHVPPEEEAAPAARDSLPVERAARPTD